MGKRLAALIAVAIAGLTAGAAPSWGAIGDIETPAVSGIPVTADSTPWAATDKPLGKYGYVEREYEYSGNAFSYDTSGDIDQTGTRITTGGPADDGRFPYRTRMIVRRPADPADFNGTVVVEWQNVTAQFDLEANWFGDPEYLLENGYAYVAISAQRVGVNFLRGWDPGRYGDLDVSARDGGGTETINNDALSYDIFGAGIKALLDGGTGADPLGSLPKPETVIATGESQSAGRLNVYYNKVQPLHEVADAFLLTVSSGTVRDDRSEPVIRVLSETENRLPRTAPDAANYRQWEVAGGSHLPRMAFDNFQAPIERDLGFTLAASCEKYPLSRVQWPLVVNAGYEHLVRWANGGAPAPVAPRGEYQGADPDDQLVRDELGIAQGGIRLPEMTVPVRLNTGINAIGPGGGIFSAFCFLLGSTEDLSDQAILSRYDDWADYVNQAAEEARSLARDRFILNQDVPRLIEMHRQVPNVRPTGPRQAFGKSQNKGVFGLSWLGTKAPQTRFELQRSSDGGANWGAVPGAGALTASKFRFFKRQPEADGDWTYRVRSKTTIPADAVRDEFVVTTPWSEPSPAITVDKTAPTVQLECPKKVKVGKRAFARIEASDDGVGLSEDPSGKQRIKTKRKGKRTVKAKAIDALGNKAVETCTVKVVKKKRKR